MEWYQHISGDLAVLLGATLRVSCPSLGCDVSGHQGLARSIYIYIYIYMARDMRRTEDAVGSMDRSVADTEAHAPGDTVPHAQGLPWVCVSWGS